ncbi:MAG: hypothetical protein OQL19_06875 [Gammaproteobacteria bacterium]|nr:hypothetical protein [Gammaproteobacteria bacterium]
MDKQNSNLKYIEELTQKLNSALKKIDDPTRIKLEKHNLQVNGISMALQRVQIGIDRTLNDPQANSKEYKKPIIAKVN